MNDPYNLLVFAVTVAGIVVMIDLVIRWWKDR